MIYNTVKMASVQELKIAISKCQFALVRKLATHLRASGVDISEAENFARELYSMKGGSYVKVIQALDL